MTTEELKVIISAETSKYDKAIKKVQKSATSLQKVLGRTFSITALTLFGKKCLDAASDLEEVQNVVDVAFGDMAEEANQFAKTAIRSFGITELQAKKLSSTFMAMTTSMGIGKQTAKTMSLSLTALAADMSSFYNVDLGTAQNALEGVITGNTRALRQFGVVINDTTLQEFALSKGIKKSVGSMSSAEKAALRYNYAVHALSLSIGDYSRTSNSWANQVRLLVNQFNQLKVALGQILQGILKPVLITLNKILAVIVAIVQSIASLFGKKNNTEGAVENVQEYGAGLGEAYDTAKKLQKTIAGFDELNTLQGKGEGADAGAGVGGAGIEFDVPDLTNFNTMVDETQKKLEKWKKVLLIIAGIVGFKWLDKMIQGLPPVVKLIEKFGKSGGSLSTWMVVTNELFSKLAVGIARLFSSIGNFTLFSDIGKWIASLGVSIRNFIGKTIRLIKSVPGALKGVGVTAAIVALVLRIRELWQTSEEFRARVTGVFDTLKSGLNAIVQAFAPVWECLANLWDTVMSVWKDCIKPAVDSITDIVISLGLTVVEIIGNFLSGPGANIIQFIADILSIVIDVVNGIIVVVKPIFDVIANQYLPWIKVAFEIVFSAIRVGITAVISTLSTFLSTIREVFDKAHEKVHNFVQDFKAVFSTIPQAIRNAMNGMIDKVEGAINNIIYKINNSGFISALNRITGGSIWLNPVYIPRLAKGGVVTTPTVAQIGEYSGARSNPEIVAPQSLLKETIDASNGELASVFAQIGQQIIQAIDRKDLDVQIGDTTIAKSAARGNRQYQLATGQSLF